ncbi:hypothetical protein bcere0019_57000 [Bacillus cereus Rock3-28]|nr:hypothetical protein bcere0019_57000 [Bacillus cereus Rock3-28]
MIVVKQIAHFAASYFSKGMIEICPLRSNMAYLISLIFVMPLF